MVYENRPKLLRVLQFTRLKKKEKTLEGKKKLSPLFCEALRLDIRICPFDTWGPHL